MPIKYAKSKIKYGVSDYFVTDEPTTSSIGEFYQDRSTVLSYLDEVYDLDRNSKSKLITMSEADHSKVLTNLTLKLYEHIVRKTDKIDFGEIPKTKGDITKMSNYEELIDCVNILRDILVEYKEDTAPVDQISLAIANIKSRKDKFINAFNSRADFAITMYNIHVLAVYSSLSFIISGSIEYIKQPRDDSFKISLDRVGYSKSKDYLLFDCLDKFNSECASGKIDQILAITNKKSFKKAIGESFVSNIAGAAVGAIPGGKLKIGILVGILIFIPTVRAIIYLVYHMRTKFSDYCDLQATLIEMNASGLEFNDSIDLANKQKIVDKQMKIANRFKKLSNLFAINFKKAEVEANKDISAEDSDLKDEYEEDIDISSPSALF